MLLSSRGFTFRVYFRNVGEVSDACIPAGGRNAPLFLCFVWSLWLGGWRPCVQRAVARLRKSALLRVLEVVAAFWFLVVPEA